MCIVCELCVCLHGCGAGMFASVFVRPADKKTLSSYIVHVRIIFIHKDMNLKPVLIQKICLAGKQKSHLTSLV